MTAPAPIDLDALASDISKHEGEQVMLSASQATALLAELKAARERIASLEADLAVAHGNVESRSRHAVATVQARRASEAELHERIAVLVAAVDEAAEYVRKACDHDALPSVARASAAKWSATAHPPGSAPSERSRG
jgi:hypothetical protein